MRSYVRRLLAWTRGRAAASVIVESFISGASVREVAYHHVSGDDWPERVKTVERELRDHIHQLEERVAELEAIVEELR